MLIDILSLFPEYFKSPFEVSILKRAQEKKLLEIKHVNIRDFSKDPHQKVDDRPFGGGPGMVLMPGPVVDAIRSVKTKGSHVIQLSPRGNQLTSQRCEELALFPHLVLLCGHYEGIDERVLKEVDEEISIGDYILTSGCLPAIVLVDAITRFIPGVLGHPQAAEEESFRKGILEAPSYTRPVDFEGETVPSVLRSGDHKKIQEWKLDLGLKKTQTVRPDLYEGYLNEQESKKNLLLEEKKQKTIKRRIRSELPTNP